MTFKIKSNPTIDASITIVGQGREQQLNVTYRHKTGKEYDALMQQLANEEITTADLLLLLIEKWDADLPVSKVSIDLLCEHQPGADLAIASAFNDAIRVERRKN